jgi:hypothetical protein
MRQHQLAGVGRAEEAFGPAPEAALDALFDAGERLMVEGSFFKAHC